MVLQSCAPNTADWIHNAPPDDSVELLETDKGCPYLRIMRPDGDAVIIHERPDSNVFLETGQDRRPEQFRETTVVFGLGLGGLVNSWAEDASGNQTLIVVEENPHIARLAMRVADLSALIASRRLILLNPNPQILQELADGLSWKYFLGQVSVVIDPDCRRCFSDGFLQNIRNFRFELDKAAKQHSAWIETGRSVVKNELSNLALTLRAPCISSLHGVLKGLPAIVVSAGPSLKLQAHLLKRAVGRAAIIATAPVLRILAAYDVKPDLLGVLDYGQNNYDPFRDVSETTDVPLAFLQQARPDVLRQYQGPHLSVLQTRSPVRMWLSRYWENRIHWDVGGNVGSFCLDLAILLGADPIILVGQDLAYPDRSSHSEGVIGRKQFNGERDMHQGMPVDAVGGGRVRSDLTMRMYIDEFNETVSRTDRSVVNTSPFGARINGTLEMPLSTALARFCSHSRQIPDLTPRIAPDKQPDLPAVLNELRDTDIELTALETVTGQAMALNQRILNILRSPDPINRTELSGLVTTQSSFSQKAFSYVRKFEVCRMYAAQEPRALSRPDLSADDNRSPLHKLMADQTWDYQKMGRLKDAATSLRSLIQDAARDVADMIKAEEAIIHGADNPEVYRSCIETMLRIGDCGTAWRMFQEAAGLWPDDAAMIGLGIELCLSREDWPSAAELMHRLKRVCADNTDYRHWEDRIAEILNQLDRDKNEAMASGDWITALLLCRKLLKAAPGHVDAADVAARCLEIRRQRIELAECDLEKIVPAGSPDHIHERDGEALQFGDFAAGANRLKSVKGLG